LRRSGLGDVAATPRLAAMEDPGARAGIADRLFSAGKTRDLADGSLGDHRLPSCLWNGSVLDLIIYWRHAYIMLLAISKAQQSMRIWRPTFFVTGQTSRLQIL
jgi:hypothetical protein